MRRLLRLVKVFVPVFSAAFLSIGCTHERQQAHIPQFHCDSYDIYPDSVDLHTGVILCAESDTAIDIRVDGTTLRTVRAERVPRSRGAFEFHSDFQIFDALFRMETPRVPREVYTPATPYELYLNPFVGAEGEHLLMSRVKNGYVIPFETRRYSWPVLNDNPQWLLAACELFNITADRSALERLGRVAANICSEEKQVCTGPVTGLICGMPRYMIGNEGLFPQWMKPVDLMECATFSVNAAWWGALHSMAGITASMARRNEMSKLPELCIDPDTLRNKIFRYMWNPAQGQFSAMMYGHPLWQMQAGATDNLAEGLAILTGLPMDEMVSMIMSQADATPAGIGIFYPRLSSGSSLRAGDELLARTIWAAAMGRGGNDEMYGGAVGALIYNICGDILSGKSAHPLVRQPLTALVLRGFCGISTAFDGLHFSPSVPSVMPGTKRVAGLKYRRSDLEIVINGTGNCIETFMVDGKPSEPFFAASNEGHHTIEITLSGTFATPSGRGVHTPSATLPDPPEPEWISDRDASFAPAPAAPKNGTGDEIYGETFVYLDGVITGDVPTRHYTLYEAPVATMVQFCRVADNRWTGFSSAPHLYIPQDGMRMVNLAEVVRGGTRILEDKKIAERFVESNRYKNNRIGFTVDVAEDGMYMVDVHYMNGLGVVNPRRRTALRRLTVDGDRKGVFVFPQLSASDWDNDPEREWQSLTDYTNPLLVWLEKGEHRMELVFYQPTPVYVDPGSNTILADHVRVIKVSDRFRKLP